MVGTPPILVLSYKSLGEALPGQQRTSSVAFLLETNVCQMLKPGHEKGRTPASSHTPMVATLLRE